MNPDPDNRLLDDLFSDQELEKLRADSLQRGLALVRQRKRERNTARLVGTLASLLAAVVVSWLIVQSRTNHGLVAQHPSAADALIDSPLVASQPAGVRHLSDQELLDLFPGRPVALIGPPGRQRLVFLDERR